MANMDSIMKYAILSAVALIIIAIILPIGLIYVSEAGSMNATVNGTSYTLTEAVDPAVLTLLTIVVPIMVVVGIVLYFLPKFRS